MSKKRKDNGHDDPGGTHRIRVRKHYRAYSVRFKSKSMKKSNYGIKSRELTGKQLLKNLIDYLNYRIERRDRIENRKKR